MIFNLTTPAVGKLPKFTYTGTYELIEDGGKNWRIKFLTSGVLTLARKLVVDVFLVGGGGAGSTGVSRSGNIGGSSGGAAGYTVTQKSVTLDAGTYEITVGAGGVAGEVSDTATAGGTTAAFGYSADGGAAGSKGTTSAAKGTNGGSGSGAGGYVNSGGTIVANAGVGGSDGSDGGGNARNVVGGTGQGTTTREFGETTGDLYAGAGGGGGVGQSGVYATGAAGGAGGGGVGASLNGVGGAGEVNTGSGGGAGYSSGGTSFGRVSAGGDGGSGVAIIRNARG